MSIYLNRSIKFARVYHTVYLSKNSKCLPKEVYKHKAWHSVKISILQSEIGKPILSTTSTFRTTKPHHSLSPRRIKRQTDVEKVSSFRGGVTWTVVAKITPLEPSANRRALFRHHIRRYGRPATHVLTCVVSSFILLELIHL